MNNKEPAMFKLHVGDDYLTITAPGGMVLMTRYPSEDDVTLAERMVEKLNKVE